MFSSSLDELHSRILNSSLAIDAIEHQLALLELQRQEKSSMPPPITIGSLVQVKPGHQGSQGMTRSDALQYVIGIDENGYYSLSESGQLWTASDLTAVSIPTPTKLPHELELFETCTLVSKSTLTRVPNGYVMTSTSGHQVLIPSNSI